MKSCDLGQAIQDFTSEYFVQIANDPRLIYEAHRLRHQVYCVERNYPLPDQRGLEVDEYDAYARHVLVRRRDDGEAVATLRLVLPQSPENEEILPIQQYCEPALLKPLPLSTTAEVSRLAVSKQRRRGNARAAGLLRIGLLQGGVRLCREAGVTHLCALMEQSLIRLLQASSIHFRPMGPPVQLYGMRQPSYARIDTIMGRLAREQPRILELISQTPVWA